MTDGQQVQKVIEIKSFKILLALIAVFFSGCAEMAKRDMVDHSAKEEAISLAPCAKPYPIAFDRVDLREFVQHGGSMLMASQPSLDVIAQKALSNSGCGTTAASLYRVRTSFDVTGKMLGAMCGYQTGGAYALFTGSFGGRCVNFNSARISFVVTDTKTRKELFSVTAETNASMEDEVAGGRFLKGIRESGGEDGEFSKSPEGRIIAGLVKKGLDALIKELSNTNVSALDKTKNSEKAALTPTVSAKNKPK